VLVDDGFHPQHVLADLVGVAQRLLVVFGDGSQKRRDFNLVEAAERGPEALSCAGFLLMALIGAASAGR
jgi:hypothetical protein